MKLQGTQYAHLGVAAFSPDGKSVLTGGAGKTARLWESATGKPLGPPLHHQHEDIIAVAFSPDGKKVLTCCIVPSADGAARLWDLVTGKPLTPPFHKGGVAAVAFSPDGKMVLAGGRLWESATGKPLGPPLEPDGLVTAAFTRDGKSVLTGGFPGPGMLWTARLWRVPQPIRADHERLLTWAQVFTGCELVDGFGTLRVLTDAEMSERRERLIKLGGPPVQE